VQEKKNPPQRKTHPSTSSPIQINLFGSKEDLSKMEDEKLMEV
jgi:hypothetical protein